MTLNIDLTQPYSINLTKAHAIILMDFLFRKYTPQDFPIKDHSEWYALRDLLTFLEQNLDELYDPEWDKILSEAQKQINSREFEKVELLHE